jgi:hypothetical protein
MRTSSLAFAAAVVCLCDPAFAAAKQCSDSWSVSYYLSSTPSEGLREMRRACQIGDELMLDGHHTALILQICDRNTIQNIGNKVVCTFRPAQGS